MNHEDSVTKRNGDKEIISFDKILNRIKKLGLEDNDELNVNYTDLSKKIIDRLYDGISTTLIDELTAQQCASLATTHPDYGILASRIMISNHHKNTTGNFLLVCKQLHEFKDIHGENHPVISNDHMAIVEKYSELFENMIDYKRDYLIDYFGFKTLERAYLLRINTVIVERPQHMWLRVAIAIHKEDIEKVKETYDLMSQKYFTHATPTLFNAGTPRPQLSSCYLIAMEKDSIQGIYNTLTDCAKISKWAGGIGMHIHNVRASGSHIRGTNGTSNGIVPMLRVFNNTARYVDQCLHPDTIIYSKKGPVPIKKIVIGDKIIADDGNMYKICKVLHSKYNGDLYKVNIKHTLTELLLTDWHPLLTIKNDTYYQRGFKQIINKLNNNLIKPEFIEVKKINKNDFIGFPIPKYIKDIQQYTNDDCRLYGIMIGDGHISKNKNQAYVSLNKESKKETMDFVINYLTNKAIHITYSYTGDKCVRLIWTTTNIFKITHELLYDDNDEKRIHCSMLHLPKSKNLNIIKGVLETDAKVANVQIVLEMTSRNVIESVRYMILRLGILTSGSSRDRRGRKHTTKYGKIIENKKISYILIVPKTQVICDMFKSKNLQPSKSFTFFEYKNTLYSIVNNITASKEEDIPVIDIEVDNEKHHNFLTHNGLVKNGGGKRSGSFAIYLEPWHGDIESFLEMKKNHGDEEMRARDLFYALWIPDLFMERIGQNGDWTLMCPDKCPGLSDVYGEEFKELYEKYETEGKGNKTMKARDLWFKILDSQIETGTPYMLYKDACNQKSNQKNLGTIKSSNLCCVRGDTLLLTDKGHQTIETLKDKTVNVWNGKEFSEVIVKQTNDNAELLTIEFSDGAQLTCTKYHKFYIQTKYTTSKQDVIKSKNVTIVEAQNLKPDMKLIKCEYPVIDNKEELKSAYTNGIFSADGTYCNNNQKERKCKFKSLKGKSYCKRHLDYQKNNEVTEHCCGISYTKKAHISLYGEKIKLLQYLDYRSTGEESNDKLNVTLPVDLKDKFFVPTNYSLQSKLDWFAGYCDGDGSIAVNGTNQSLQISCIHKEFLLQIKLMLQTCGISSKVTVNMNERLSYLPDGKGGMTYYESKKFWRLLVGSNDLQKLVELGFSPKRLIINEHEPQRNASHFVKISKIVDNGEIDKTFCFTEKKRHAGIFNGVITSQCEIIEYSDENETAVCNLASIALSKFITETPSPFNEKITIYTTQDCKWCDLLKALLKRKNIDYTQIVISLDNFEDFKQKHNVTTLPQLYHGEKLIGGYSSVLNILKNTFNYELLHKVTKVVTRNLNNVIDINFYPTDKTKKSNMRHRPIGIGIQGLADAFAMMDIPFYSEEAKLINKNIFETMYHGALESSWESARKDGHYETFKGSPTSEGILQFDMWNVTPSTRYDWDKLKLNIKKDGIRNSLLLAPMPTASTSQILGNNECFEPFTSNIYVRRTMAGEFVCINKFLLRELIELGLWTDDIKNSIIRQNGSVQGVSGIPKALQDKYKIVWEIPMKHILEMAADRGAFICQSQSTNLWMKEPTYNKLTAMHFFAWKKGLKTGIYYLRTKAKAAPQQFTIEPDKNNSVEEEEECLMCGS